MQSLQTPTGKHQFPRKLASLIASQLFQSTGHKGHYGRIGVIGGSFEYTGAPYYAAISSLKSGADLSMIFCSKDAGIPIKSYSPQNMVVPVLGTELGVGKILRWLKSVHILVIGPGLGREEDTYTQIEDIMRNLNSYNPKIAVVGDADFLFFMSQSQDLVDHIRSIAGRVILTPNVREFQRLYEYLFKSEDFVRVRRSSRETRFIAEEHVQLTCQELRSLSHPYFAETVAVAENLNNCFIFRKGAFDFITNGKIGIIINTEGSKKRCGGIGDILSGVIASFTHQSLLYSKDKEERDVYILKGLAGASLVTREAARLAERTKRISLVAPDIIETIVEGVIELQRND